MKPDEFKEGLDRLGEVLFRGLTYYSVWKSLLLHDPTNVSWPLDDQNEVLGRFRGFMTPVVVALHDMAIMEFTKLFDTDSKSASLTNLLSAARQDASLVPHAGAPGVKEISVQLRRSKRIRADLKRIRNQQLAHIDVRPLPVGPVRNSDFEKLAEDVKSAFNSLSTAHDGRFFSWDPPLQSSDRDTTEILRLLIEDVKGRKRRYNDEMIRIGREEMRRREALMGRRLDSEELLSIRQSFGLTDEQMQLVEEQYGASSPGPG